MEAISANDGIMHHKYLLGDGFMIRFAFQLIADSLEGDRFRLSYIKVVKSIAMAMLAVKGDYYLGEYISALKHSLDINGIQPPSSDDQIDTSSTKRQQPAFDPARNLFEGFKDYDLSFLHGYAIIIPQGDIKDYDRKRDHVIKLLHPFYS